ncbi:MAG: hypothetical protein ABIX37_03945 [Gammaproteobacteria bacterium]
MPLTWRLTAFLSILLVSAATLAQGSVRLGVETPVESPMGLDSAALRATVFGTPPNEMAPLPGKVPLAEINIRLPGAKPVPEVFWFDRRLRVWFSGQRKPAPLVIVIAGTGAAGNNEKIAILRAALYGAGYHVLTMPSPTFPGFIVSASGTGVAGDLLQDGQDLYAAVQEIIAHLPSRVRITEINVLGYSLGGANAAMLKSIDATEGRLHIHRAVMINPPVNLFATLARFDQLFATSIGTGEQDIERLYRKYYARLANVYRASNSLEVDEKFLFSAAPDVLATDAELAAAIALYYRLSMMDMFFAGDLFSGAGVVVDPGHPPQVGQAIDEAARILRSKPLSEYLWRVFMPYYLKHRPGSTVESLLADNRLDIIGDALRNDPDYYAQTNRDDLILDGRELEWLQATMGPRIQVYDHGGHMGNLGARDQVADMLDMLAGRWTGAQ